MSKRTKLTWGGMRLLRESKGYTQTEWGALLGMSQSQISELETDHGDEPVGAEVAKRALEAPVKSRTRAGGKRREQTPQPSTPESTPEKAEPPSTSTTVPPAYEAAANAVTRFLTTLTDLISARYAAGFRSVAGMVPPEREVIVPPPPRHASGDSAVALLPGGAPALSGDSNIGRYPGPTGTPETGSTGVKPQPGPTGCGMPLAVTPQPIAAIEVDALVKGLARKLLPVFVGTAVLMAVGVGCLGFLYRQHAAALTESLTAQVANAMQQAAFRSPQATPFAERTPELGDRKRGPPLPSTPVPGTVAPPCRASEKAINGGCYIKVADQPPCNPDFFEYGNACYIPVHEPSKPPVGGEGK